jgi:hypothetical protein
MKTLFGRFASMNRFFDGVEHPDVKVSLPSIDVRTPLARRLLKVDASVAGCAVPLAALVLIVLSVVLSEVGNPVVTSDAVDVVNLAVRKTTMEMSEGNAMSLHQLPVDFDHYIALGIDTPGRLSNASLVMFAGYLPRKDACCGVVVKPAADGFDTGHTFSIACWLRQHENELDALVASYQTAGGGIA